MSFLSFFFLYFCIGELQVGWNKCKHYVNPQWEGDPCLW